MHTPVDVRIYIWPVHFNARVRRRDHASLNTDELGE